MQASRYRSLPYVAKGSVAEAYLVLDGDLETGVRVARHMLTSKSVDLVNARMLFDSNMSHLGIRFTTSIPNMRALEKELTQKWERAALSLPPLQAPESQNRHNLLSECILPSDYPQLFVLPLEALMTKFGQRRLEMGLVSLHQRPYEQGHPGFYFRVQAVGSAAPLKDLADKLTAWRSDPSVRSFRILFESA